MPYPTENATIIEWLKTHRPDLALMNTFHDGGDLLIVVRKPAANRWHVFGSFPHLVGASGLGHGYLGNTGEF